MSDKQIISRWVFYVSVCAQLLLIIILGMRIHRKLQEKNILGVYTTPLQKEHLAISIIDNERIFWEHKGGEIDEKASTSWLPYVATYRFNHDGMNSMRDYAIPKPENTIRIMTLGDSFTYGAWVNTEDNYPSVLERLLNGRAPQDAAYEVLNLGEIGYDVDYMTERYYRRGGKYNPDVIVMLLPECDFTEIAGVMGYLHDKRTIQLRSTSSELHQREKEATDLAHEDLQRFTDNKIELFQFERLSVFASSIKVPIILLTDNRTTARGVSALKYFVERHPQVYFSILPAFDRLPDLHPSTKGHGQIAQAVQNILVQRHIVP